MRRKWITKIATVCLSVAMTVASASQGFAVEETSSEATKETEISTEMVLETQAESLEFQEETTEEVVSQESNETDEVTSYGDETQLSIENKVEIEQTAELQTEQQTAELQAEQQTEPEQQIEDEGEFGITGELSEEPFYNASTQKTITITSNQVQYGQSEARTILNMINEMRTSSTDAWYWNSDNETKTYCTDLKPLVYDYTLEKIAMKRAYEIALSFSHTRPNGNIGFSAFDEFGVYGTCFAVGENISAGYTNATATNKGWREDDENAFGQGHRRNMLNNMYNSVGIGHAYFAGIHYWVEEFAYNTALNTTYEAPMDGYMDSSTEVLESRIMINNLELNSSVYNLKLNEKTSYSCNYGISIMNHWPSYQSALPVNLPDSSTTYTIADLSIAVLKNDNSEVFIQGLKEGDTTITVNVNGNTASSEIKVHDCNNHWDKGTITKTPNCTQTGEKNYRCQICQATKTQVLPINSNNHDYSSEWTVDVQPGWQKTGYKSHHCRRCGERTDITELQLNGLTNIKGNVWYYLKNGQIESDYTGLILYYKTWYYIEKGILKWNYTGLTNYYGTWYYIENGRLNWNYTGLTNYYGTWYYIENGRLKWNYTGLTNYYGTWYYIENGRLNWNYTGLTNYYGTWYYIENGRLNWNYTGLTNYYGTWYYVKNGKLNAK